MNQEEIVNERRAKRFWVTFIVTLLGLQIAIGAVSIFLATGDKSVAVVPDYHRAAMNWDETKKERQAALLSGWTWRLSVSDVVDGRGMRAVELLVIDAEQSPIDQLRIAGRAYHHAEASATYSIAFQPAGNGRYITLVPMQRDGLWQFDLETAGASGPMTTSQTVEFRATGNRGDQL